MKLQRQPIQRKHEASAARPGVAVQSVLAAAILCAGTSSVAASGGGADKRPHAPVETVGNSSAGADFDVGAADHRRPVSESAASGAYHRDRAPASSLAAQAVPRRADLEHSAPVGGRRPGSLVPSGLGALGIVLGLVAVVFWVVRRWVPSVRVADNGAVRVVGRASLTPKHHVSVIQLGRRLVMVGVAADRLTSLCEICDPEEVAELVARMESGRRGSAFDNQLLREAAAFEETAEADVDETRASRAGNDREPLNALLHRLRSLQSKG